MNTATAFPIFRTGNLLLGTLIFIAATFLALLPLQLAGAAVMASGAAVSIAFYPPIALGILALSVPFQDALVLPLGGLTFTATEMALGLLVLTWFLRGAVKRDLRLCDAWLLAPVGLFITALLLSASIAPVVQLGLKEVVKWIEFSIVLMLGASILKTPRDILAVSAILLLAGTAEALYGLSQTGGGTGPLGFVLDGSVLRAYGHFGQPNPFAAYAAMTAVFAIGLTVALLFRTPHSLLRPWGLALLLALCISLAAIIASFSRSALIAVAAATIVTLAAHGGRALWLMVLGGSFATLLATLGTLDLLPMFITNRLSIVFDYLTIFDAHHVILTSDNFAIVQRMAIWQSAWEMFLNNPVLGAGLGNFDTTYPAYALPGWLQLPGHAHNYYLNLLAETGALGLAAYMLLLSALTITAIVCVRSIRRENPITTNVPIGALLYGTTLAVPGLLAMLTVHHLFDNLYVHGMIAHVALIFCLALAARRMAQAPGTVLAKDTV